MGAGIFGLYATRRLLELGARVCLLDVEKEAFTRASTVNQARVHLGYHYPRSLGTAANSAKAFHRFVRDYKSAIQTQFRNIYAVAKRNSLVSAAQFENFCRVLEMPAERVNEGKYFRPGTVEAAWETSEYVFDAGKLLDSFLSQIENHSNLKLCWGDWVSSSEKEAESFLLSTQSGLKIRAKTVISATYASTNAVHKIFGIESLPLRYELTEMALGEVLSPFDKMGVTLMDGPFFSFLPFGLSGLHSLSAVEFTPHRFSESELPELSCQASNKACSGSHLQNCNRCEAAPKTLSDLMIQLAKKFMVEEWSFKHQRSLFTVKTILKTSTLDDSRPTSVMKFSSRPTFISVLSGKVNTIYELDEILL